jgi:hypothetical protein
MSNNLSSENKTIKTLRWTARIIGTLFVAFTLFIGIGEMLEGYINHRPAASSTFDTTLIITFTFWGIGLAGLILALWKEGLGGIISLVSFIIFNFLVGINTKPGGAHYSSVLLIFLIPSILYLICWWMSKSKDKVE